jgi:hypothetical protein
MEKFNVSEQSSSSISNYDSKCPDNKNDLAKWSSAMVLKAVFL